MAMKEISSQSAIDHKEKTHNTHVYGECVLFYLCIFKYGNWFFKN